MKMGRDRAVRVFGAVCCLGVLSSACETGLQAGDGSDTSSESSGGRRATSPGESRGSGGSAGQPEGIGGHLVTQSSGGATPTEACDPLASQQAPKIVGQVPPNPGKLDVLFVVDNSFGAGSYYPLGDAARSLIERLSGQCDSSESSGEGGASQSGEGSSTAVGPCGAKQDAWLAGLDVHLGVITTSLGTAGNELCERADAPEKNDRAHLLPSVRPALEGMDEFARLRPDSDVEGVIGEVQAQLEAAGDKGCGYESPLESAYRFLVDPAPPEKIVVTDSSTALPEGVDQELLGQRQRFLRPDSALMVVILTDEDDCSLKRGGTAYPFSRYGYLVASSERMARPTAQCATNPDDPCCMSCLQVDAKACDPSCEGADGTALLSVGEDAREVRCHDQKHRFGFELTFPVERYVDGFHKVAIQGSDCGPEHNPLFVDADGYQRRLPEQVVVTAVVGVPWQDIASEASLDSDRFELVSGSDLAKAELEVDGALVSRWDLMLGTFKEPALDPFMVPALEPRKGVHPLTGESTVSPDAHGKTSINGHENAFDEHDVAVEPSCMTRLAQPNEDDFLCAADNAERAMCKDEPLAEVEATTTRYWSAPAPTPRILSVLKGLDDQATLGTLCEKDGQAEQLSSALHAALNRLGDVVSEL